MAARAILDTPIGEPQAERSPGQPAAADPTRASDRHPASSIPANPSGPSGARWPTAFQPDLLRRLPAPLQRPALILSLQAVQGNRQVARALAQRAETAPAAPEGEPVSAASGNAVPAPPAPEVIDRATAMEVLTLAYGAVKEIDPGKRVLLPNREALWKRADKVFKGLKNPANGDQPWTDGDAEKYHPGADGFVDERTNTMYLNKEPVSWTNAVHELLHLNAAADFDAAVGASLSEGATEFLAIQALIAADVPMTGKIAYPDAVALVTRLVNLAGIGKDTLIDAFFNGADSLIAKFDALKGTGAFAEVRAAAELNDWTVAGMLVGSSGSAPAP